MTNLETAVDKGEGLGPTFFGHGLDKLTRAAGWPNDVLAYKASTIGLIDRVRLTGGQVIGKRFDGRPFVDTRLKRRQLTITLAAFREALGVAAPSQTEPYPHGREADAHTR